MKDTMSFLFGLLIFGIIGACMIWAGLKDYNDTYEKGYLDACKDMQQGKLKYKLIDNPDGTREWKKIEENKK